MIRFLPVMIIFCFGLLGCESVKPSDIIGTWVVTNQSRLRFLPAAQQKAVAKIVLEPNGTFVASEIPEDLLYGPPEAADRLVTGNGDWKFVPGGSGQHIQLVFQAITVGQRGRVPYGTQLNVAKDRSSLNLFYFDGDPDQGRRIEFERMPGGPGSVSSR